MIEIDKQIQKSGSESVNIQAKTVTFVSQSFYKDEPKNNSIRLTYHPYDFSKNMELLLDGFVGRSWLVTIFNNWLSSNKKLLWITGGPGSGKSTAICYLFNEYKGQIKSIFLFGKCKRENKQLSSIETIIFQVCSQLDITESQVEDIVSIKSQSPFEMLNGFFRIIEKYVQSKNKTIVIFLDGLDELTANKENIFCHELKRYILETPSWVRFVIGSQPDTPNRREFNEFNTVNLDEEQESKKDLEKFIHKKLIRYIYDNKLNQPDVDMLIDRSGASFVYIKHLLENISSISDIDFDKLPVGLGGYYFDLFQKMFGEKNGGMTVFNESCEKEYEEKYVRPLSMIITSFSPILVSDAKLIFGLSSERAVDNIYSRFRPILESSDKGFSLYHNSIKQWLINKATSEPFHLYEKEGHEYWKSLGLEIYGRIRK